MLRNTTIQTSRLLSLPPELRAAIFNLLLVRPETIELYNPCGSQGHLTHHIGSTNYLTHSHPMHTICSNCAHWINDGRPLCKHSDSELRSHFRESVAQPALTRVCKSIRRETLPVFYGADTFLIHSFARRHGFGIKAGDVAVLRYAKAWLESIGRGKRGLLKRLFMVEDWASKRAWLRGFRGEVGVKRVVVGEDEEEVRFRSRFQLLKREVREWRYGQLEFERQ